MGKLTKFFDKVADALVPKEIAPFLGPASMMFAGPLGMPLALGLGQLGSAKMHSGKLDPYTAMGTFLSAQGYKARNPQGYGRIGSGLKEGLGTFLPGGASPMDFGASFMEGYNNPGYISGLQTGLELPDKIYPGDLTGEQFDTYKSLTTDAERSNYMASIQPGAAARGEGAPMLRPDQTTPTDELISPDKGFFESQGTLDEFTQNVGETLFPGFTDPETGDFDLTKTLTTIGSTTTLSQVLPLAEELKKQEMKDEQEEGAAWQSWFESYKKTTGRSYGDSPYPDPEITRLWNKYGKPLGLAMGGRVGYNEGGDTGIIAAAPGMPEGMQLDGRDGLFISQGVEEKADDVPAMLSKNEFVLTADAMKGFDKMSGGSGDPRAAAQKMYQFMDQMEAIA